MWHAFWYHSFVTVLESALTARHLGLLLTQCSSSAFYIRQPHACFVHSISLFPLHNLLKGSDSLMIAIVSCPDCFSHPKIVCRQNYACHMHSVLFQPMQSSLSCLPCAFCFVPALQSLLTSFWRFFTGLVQLIFGFSSWFHTIWFYCSHTFHNFLS